MQHRAPRIQEERSAPAAGGRIGDDVPGTADAGGGGAGVDLALAHPPVHGGARLDDGPGTHVRAGQQRRASAHDRVRAHADGTDVDEIAVDPPALEVDLGLDGGAGLEGQHAGDRRDRVEVDIAAHRVAQQAGVPAHPRSGGDGDGRGEVRDVLREPQPQVDGSRSRVRARAHSGQQEPCGTGGDEHASPWGHEDGHQGEDEPPADRGHIRTRGTGHVDEDEGEDDPAHRREHVDGDAQQGLQGLHRVAGARDGAARSGGCRLVRVHREGDERTEAGCGVHVAHRDGRVLRAQAGDQLRGRERSAAGVEEVRVHAGACAQDGLPLLRAPAGVLGQVVGSGLVGLLAGQRPRQGRAVDLARGLGRQIVDEDEAGDQGRWEGLPQGLGPGVAPVVARGLGCEVADEQLHAACSLLDCGRAAGHAGQRLERGVDLAQLDAAPAQLDLLVRAPHEDEAVGVHDDEVAGAVGTLPPQGGHRRVLLGILLRVEVAGQAHAPDDELTGLPVLDGDTGGRVDDGHVPAVQRQPDPHGISAVQGRGARDDGGLGGPVRVPHLAIVVQEAGGQLRRARLAAEDEEADVLQRLRRPQRCERGHGGDDSDGAAGQPRSQIHAGLHE